MDWVGATALAGSSPGVHCTWPKRPSIRADVEAGLAAGDSAPEPGPEPRATSAEKEKRIVVPEAAVVEIAGVPPAFVLERDTVRATSVTIGERKGGRVTIETGLRAGQRIVADPPPSLRDKDRIRFADN